MLLTWSATDIPSSGPSTTSYTVTDLTNSVRCVSAIRAVNANGHGLSALAIAIPISDS